MTYFVTGATGFIGRHLVERLLERDGDIHVLVREESQEKLEALGWGDRVKPVIGDLSQPSLGVSDEDKQALQGVDHFFHLAAIYDMTADDEERNRRLNVLGTQNAVDLANEIGAGRGRYSTFADGRANRKGRFSVRYRFRSGSSRGRTFTFRVKLRGDARFPYASGYSKRVTVRVR